VGSKATGWHHG